jgi:hypothetical protein
VGRGRAERILVLKALALLATATFFATAPLAEWHHFYLGLALAGAAVAWRRPWLFAVATLIMTDDAWQHLRQAAGSPNYASPLHHLFAVYLWPHPPVQWLTARLEAFFG